MMWLKGFVFVIRKAVCVALLLAAPAMTTPAVPLPAPMRSDTIGTGGAADSSTERHFELSVRNAATPVEQKGFMFLGWTGTRPANSQANAQFKIHDWPRFVTANSAPVPEMCAKLSKEFGLAGAA
jgi:hypothetical protein